jgi:plastocyanin
MKRFFSFVLGGAILLPLLACDSNSSMPTQSPNPTPSPGGAHIVSAGQGGNRFVDSVSGTSATTVRVGETVQWSFVSSMPHSATSGACCTPSGLWDSGTRTSPATFSHRFDQAGTFPYFCTVHGSSMTGTVTVMP